jgi:hypothetical protein
VRFEGHPWRLLRDFVGSATVPLDAGWTSVPFTPVDLYARMWQALGNRRDGAVTFFGEHAVLTLQLSAGRVIGLEEIGTVGGLLHALKQEGLLSATQVMVLEQVAGGEESSVRAAVEARNLVSATILDQLEAKRSATALARVFGWGGGQILAGPVPDIPLNSTPPTRVDTLLSYTIRSILGEEDLRSALPGGFETRIAAVTGDPTTSPIELSPQEAGVVVAANRAPMKVTDLLTAGLVDTPERAMRTALLLLQFDLVRVL